MKKFKDSKFYQGWVKLKNDMKPMSFKEKCEHLWEYYKVWLLILALVIMGISLLCTIVAGRTKQVMVSGMMVNVYMEQEGVNYLTTEYRELLGATSKKQVAELDITGFGDMMDPEYGESSYYASMILPARVTGAMLDYMLLDDFAMGYYSNQDIFMDLREFFSEEELAQLEEENRLIYPLDEDRSDMPIAVKITELAFIKEYVNNTEGDIYFALSGSSPRPEMCHHVWQYLHDWKADE